MDHPPTEKREQELRYWNTFSVHVWYEPLKELTFPSAFIPVSVDEAEALVSYQERLLESLSIDGATGPEEDIPDYGDIPQLMKMEERMHDIIERFVVDGGGAMVKLSDRSPKDATTERGRIHQFLSLPEHHINDLAGPISEKKADTKRSLSSNAVGLPAVYRGMMGALKVRSGREALKLILISFRTLADVKERLKYKDKLWELNIVIRQWVEFDIAYEMRGFVCENQLTALSQYYYDCYFDVLASQRDLIARSVQHYWENEVKGKPPYDSYVIDFTILPHEGVDENGLLPVVIVELNPFDEYTDAALFNWNMNRRLLHEGPFKFRVVEHPTVETKRTWWKRILSEHISQDRKELAETSLFK